MQRQVLSRIKGLFVILLLALTLPGCGGGATNTDETITKAKVTGLVQKGPFLSGTSVTIYELHDDLTQTGKSFNTQIANNSGSFELNNVNLSSRYVEVRADGYYFNEVSGTNSVAPITLYALVDLQETSTINVNVLTHLEKERVKYLVQNGSGFVDAKKQAQQEVLRVFNLEKSGIPSSEILDISQDGEDNACLLTISAVLQGSRTEGGLSELLGNMASELTTTGTVSSSIGSALVSTATDISPVGIRSNLLNRYAAMGIAVDVPDFSAALTNFVANSSYRPVVPVSYPASGSYGRNVLDRKNTVYPVSTGVSLTAEIPPGSSVKVKVTGESDNWAFSPDSVSGWQWSEYDATTHSRTFTSGSDTTPDLQISLNGGGVTLEVYENGSILPTWTREIFPQSGTPVIQLSASDLTIGNAQVGQICQGSFRITNTGPSYTVSPYVIGPYYGVFIYDEKHQMVFRNYGGWSGLNHNGDSAGFPWNTSSNHLGETSEPAFVIPAPGTYELVVEVYSGTMETLSTSSKQFTVATGLQKGSF